MTAPFIVNHLWQSSCVALLAALLALMLRGNSPKVRYWVWLSASLKFLLPFALLASFGSLIPRPAQQPVFAAAPAFAESLVQATEPFSFTSYASIPAHDPVHWMPVMVAVVWVIGFLTIILVRCRGWLRVRVALQAGTPIELPIPVRALITPGTEEPGIVGLLRPVLILPAKLLDHLNPQQLEAILTHELCHVSRRDNLFATVHMTVEAIFWFNPLVWWIGSRMVEERELACDEEVLRTGCKPSDYVEGILNVCRFYTESPLPCVSGVTGADVKKRLRAILAGSIASELTAGKKFILAAMAMAVLSAPVVIGMLTAPVIRAQIAPANTPKFEVVSIKPCKEPPQVPGGMYPPRGSSSPGNLRTNCFPLLDPNDLGLIRGAYASDPFTPINGGPSWVRSAFYEIDAKAEGTPSVATMRGPMMQALLEEYFHLKIHQQTIEGPVYFLSIARGGPRLHSFPEGSCTPIPPDPELQVQRDDPKYCKSNISGLSPSSVEAHGATVDAFAKLLRPVLHRPVIDQTGITGRFDMRVVFSRDETNPAPGADPTGIPSIFTAIEEQLGLRLESGRGPIETLVIDRIERPPEN